MVVDEMKDELWIVGFVGADTVELIVVGTMVSADG
jgi:hypothetical protein